jgi:hypothetical protein
MDFHPSTQAQNLHSLQFKHFWEDFIRVQRKFYSDFVESMQKFLFMSYLRLIITPVLIQKGN